MQSRRKLLVANWKMFGSTAFLADWARDFAHCGTLSHVFVGLCPAAPYIGAAATTLSPLGVSVGAQDVSREREGAFTGDVAAAMVKDAGASFTLVGHSERRLGRGETLSVVRAKLERAFDAGLAAILCVGETLEEREAGRGEAVVLEQLESALSGLDVSRLMAVAYEPVWAIGTGKSASPETAQAMHAALRAALAAKFGEAGQKLPLLYGGSVKPDNAAALFAQPDLDGALVGGAALKPEQFYGIGEALARTTH